MNTYRRDALVALSKALFVIVGRVIINFSRWNYNFLRGVSLYSSALPRLSTTGWMISLNDFAGNFQRARDVCEFRATNSARRQSCIRNNSQKNAPRKDYTSIGYTRGIYRPYPFALTESSLTRSASENGDRYNSRSQVKFRSLFSASPILQFTMLNILSTYTHTYISPRYDPRS